MSIVAQPAEYFRSQLLCALKNQRFKIDQNIEFYLVDMMTRFMVTDNLFVVDKNDGKKHEEVLALLLREALSSSDLYKKQRELRRLGDVSLYTAGFFSDSLARKVVDVDYYIGMGQNAYGRLANLKIDEHFCRVFAKLAESFTKFVDVLGEVSEATTVKDAKNILRLYEIWLKTGSEKAEKSLKEAGIIPNVLLKPDIQ